MKKIFYGLSILSLACLAFNSQAKVIKKETASFNDAVKIVSQKDKKYGSKNVLVVLDIDNTLLTGTTDLGGDIWYQWQTGKLAIKPKAKDKVSCLYQDTIGLLYELLPMKPTEKIVPSVVSKWQKKHTVFALTSRSPGTRFSTERELNRNGMNFENSALTPVGSSKAPLYKGKIKRGFTYIDGVMLTSGQDKGVMLDYVLKKTKHSHSFKAIVFVDDSTKNINKVKAAFSKKKYKNVDTTVVHYTKIEDDRIKENGTVLTQKQADKMASDWKKLNTAINTVFPKRSNVCLAK